MTVYQLAQLNVARMTYAMESPELADFVDNLDRINALADEAPGFVWRLQLEDGDTTDIDLFGSDQLVNMSVWDSIESLHDYVYRTEHTEILSRKKEWFDRLDEAYLVLWWVPEGRLPTLFESKAKLELLRAAGPSAEAFTFKQAFPAPGVRTEVSAAAGFDDLCPAN